MEHKTCPFCEKAKMTPIEARALRKLSKVDPHKAGKILERCCRCSANNLPVGFSLAEHMPSRGGSTHSNTKPGLDFYDRR